MEEYEYCLLWASPRKTVIVKPGGQVEKFSNRSQSQGILTGLQTEGWETVAFNIEPTVDMLYMFKRPLQTLTLPVRDGSLPDVGMIPPAEYQQPNLSL